MPILVAPNIVSHRQHDYKRGKKKVVQLGCEHFKVGVMKDRTFRQGQIIRYNDGRIGHCNVEATVLSVDTVAMIVQFHDRADTTTIRFSDRKWMDYLS